MFNVNKNHLKSISVRGNQQNTKFQSISVAKPARQFGHAMQI